MGNAYKVLGGSHTRWEGSKESGSRVSYGPGDVMRGLSETEIANFGGSIQEIEEGGANKPASAAAGVEAAPSASVSAAIAPTSNGAKSLLSGSVQDVKIAVLGSNSVEELEALKAEEVAGANRAAILKAIDARITKLKKV